MTQLCWDNDAFVNQQTVLPHKQSVADIKPILSVGGFYRVPIPLFHKIDERSDMLVLFGSCGEEFDPHFCSLCGNSGVSSSASVSVVWFTVATIPSVISWWLGFQLCGFGLCSCHSGWFFIRGTFLLACDIVVYSTHEHLSYFRPFLTNVCLSSHQQFKVVRIYQMTRRTDGSVPSNVVMGEAIMTLLSGMTEVDHQCSNVSPKT